MPVSQIQIVLSDEHRVSIGQLEVSQQIGLAHEEMGGFYYDGQVIGGRTYEIWNHAYETVESD